MHIFFLMYMAREDPRRTRKERRKERGTEINEKNEKGRGTRKKDWHGSIEEGEREGTRKTKKHKGKWKEPEEGTRGEQGRKISTIEVKEEQNKGTEGEQGFAEFKWLTLQGRNNKAKQWHDASEGGPKEARGKKLTLMRNRVKVQKGRALKGSINLPTNFTMTLLRVARFFKMQRSTY